MPTSLEAALALFDGVSPDYRDWNGGPPRISVDFSSSTVKQIGKEALNPDGTWAFRAKYTFGSSPYGGGGISSDSPLFNRFESAYPYGVDDLTRGFEQTVGKRAIEFKTEIKGWFITQTWKPFGSIVGHFNRDWDNPVLKSFSVTLGDDATYSRGSLRLPFVVTASFTAIKRATVAVGPFTAMSDRELDTLIGQWESEAPENFWMDGELQMNRTQAYRMYRDRWRKMTPRAQQDVMDDLGSNGRRYGSDMGELRASQMEMMTSLIASVKRVADRYASER